jgi:dTDP-4-amino-4,6-dideoxygalactose transaminase
MNTEPPFIPISTVDITEEIEALVIDVLRSGQIAQGPRVAELEGLFSEASGTDHAVAVSSGTAALFLSLEVLDLRPGDEVITSPFTFVATLNAIVMAGATARFADIGDDFNITADSVASLITDRTRAILPVHLYGCPADMPALEAIASANGLAVIEDAAQAVGGSVDGTPVGGWGLGCFSLYATKNVTTAEGGIVTTNDARLADRMRLLRNQGMRARYEYETRGYNLRLTDLHAAVGVPQMRNLDALTKRRRTPPP